jgi:hypothetical protein
MKAPSPRTTGPGKRRPFLVYFPAVQPDLRRCPRRRREATHLNHRLGEHAGIAAILAHQRVLRPAVEELLIGVQEAALRDEVPVVGVVEGVRRLVVERREVAVAAGARLLALPGEGGVDVGLGVDAAAEDEAARLPHGVRSRERRHVARREPLGRERGDEGRDAGARAREVGVGGALARRARVLPEDGRVTPLHTNTHSELVVTG